MTGPDCQGRRFSRPYLWLIRVIGVIVPRRLRADWRQEWEGELRYRETLLDEWDRLLRHEVALITLKTARAGLHLLFHQRFSTGMNQELPGQCNLIT